MVADYVQLFAKTMRALHALYVFVPCPTFCFLVCINAVGWNEEEKGIWGFCKRINLRMRWDGGFASDGFET